MRDIADQLLVSFSGEGSGAGGLTWGQQTIWPAIAARGGPIWLTGVRALPGGTTVEDVAELLAFLMGRHQSLRTRLLVRDGEAIQQMVSAAGEIALQVIDVDAAADPGEAARALEADWRGGDLDYATEWPVRMAVVRHRGVPAYRVWAICHTVSDGYGVRAMLADIDARDPVTGAPSGPVTAMEPLEQAQWQASAAGQRRSRIAEEYWERLLRSISPRRFPEPPDLPEACYGRVSCESRAAYLAVQVLADRTGFDTSPVLLAAFAVAMARVTGINPAVPRVYVHNRFRPGLADTVSPVAQTCPCEIDVAGISFDEAVKRAYNASLAAYKHAYFEPARIRQLLRALRAERGAGIDLSCVYNDRRMYTPRGVGAERPRAQQVRAALPLSTLSWEDTAEAEDDCHVMVLDSPDTIKVQVLTDSQYVARDQVEALLREIEAVAVEAACDPGARTGV